MELTYDEFVDILDGKCIAGSTDGYFIQLGIHEITDKNLMLKSSLAKERKVNITFVEIRLASNLTTNKAIKFTRKLFFYTILGDTQSLWGLSNKTPQGFIQLIPNTYKSKKPFNNTGVDKMHWKCDCIIGSIVNGIREPNLYSFALVKPSCHKKNEELRIKHIKKINKSVLSNTRFLSFYWEDDDHKPVDFNGETFSFTCQLVKVYFLYY